MVTMTPEYAQLSYFTGLAAGAADEYLGRVHFAPKCRSESASFTWEKLRALKAEAIGMGVPAEAFTAIPDEADVATLDFWRGLL